MADESKTPFPPPNPPATPSSEAPTGTFRRRDENPETRMGFMDHLMELRKRLMAALFAVVLTTTLALIFFKPIFLFLRAPIDNVNEKFRTDDKFQALLAEQHMDPQADVVRPISTDPLGLMLILMKIAVYAGLVLSSPIVLYELWAFVAPGLRPREIRAIRPVLVFGVFFFLGGAAFCYYLVFPYTMEFVVWLDVYLGVVPSYTPDSYLDLLLVFMLIFGALFEIPLVVAILAKLGILKPAWLARYWRVISLACFLAGSLASPGTDIMSMLLMSGALVVLYAISIGAAYAFYPRKGREEQGTE